VVGVGGDDDDVVVSESRMTMAFDVAHVPLRCAFFFSRDCRPCIGRGSELALISILVEMHAYF